MPRKARKLSSCGVYHIMIRGINRMTIFNDDADNLNFLHILDFCADENFIIMAYCLMGNHLHLLAKDCNDSLQHMMKAIGVRLLQPPLPADRPALPGPLQIPACHNQRLLPAGTALYPPQPGRCRNGAGYAGLPVEQLH